MIGIVTGREIKKNRDGGQNVRVLQVQIADGDDIQTVELFMSSGLDFSPQNGARVLIVEAAGAAYKVAIACDDLVEPSVSVGERKMYSLDAGGSPAAIVHCMEDGQLVINNGGGTAVEFKRLQTAFNQLQADFDAHVHPAGLLLLDSTAGACTGSTAAPVASTADITAAESPTIEVP